ncbi:uncharacterized protein LOC115449060 [Manduca sexta]|uniref:uncharacterized protein LOC115449060 n=1 Tax=Manduca sexta TaxID=7130 RepID=UPI00188FA876|nr:uncharacterized protein LOC115449060 [Manduca sexta]
MLQPLDSLYNDILRDYNFISHFISNNISKRAAWFAGAGTVFKHIFGTMDEDDANHYNTAIQNLYYNDKVLSNVVNKSLIVSQMAIHNVNQSLHEMNINQAKLNDALDKITIVVNNMSHAIQAENFQVALNSMFNTLQSNLLSLSFKIEDILNSVLLVKSNILHPSVLTPKQLYHEIVNNLKIVPKDKYFPLNLELNNIHKLLNIASLVCYHLDNKLVFVIKIPLVSTVEYNLYKSIPLPTSHATDNTFVMIQPFESYIALSKDKLSFSYYKNLDSCQNIATKTYLCEITDIYSVPGNPSCEIEIITKTVSKLPDSCQYQILRGHVDIWHKLHNEKWIFVQSELCKLSIECRNNITETIISGTGILNLPLDCVAYHKNYRIARKTSPRINIPKLTPTFNILNDSCCNSNKFKELNLLTPKLKNVNLDNLKSFVNTNQLLMKELDYIKSPNYLRIGFPVLSTVLLILCFCVIIYCSPRANDLVFTEA